MIDQGYAQCSVDPRSRVVADFSCWLEQQRVTIEEITEEHVKQYFKQPQHLSRRGYAFTLRRFLDFLRQQGIIPEKPASIVQTPAILLADEFRSYLRQERALAESTIIYYLKFISRF